MDCTTTSDRIAQAAAAIKKRWSCAARTAVILGTGLGELADEIPSEASISYGEIPGFTRSTALAHKGRLVCGQIAGRPVMLLQGRCHLYEGYSTQDVSFPARVLAALGIENLIVTNAAGGLNPNFVIGDVMVIDDHINLMFFGRILPPSTNNVSPSRREGPEAFGRPPRTRVRLYDAQLKSAALTAARRGDFPLQTGVYLSVSGPCYETRAEYRAFRRLGADCVGMSTVPEVLIAAATGLRVLGLSTITNVACPDAPKKVTAEEVVEVARIARPRVKQIIEAILASHPA